MLTNLIKPLLIGLIPILFVLASYFLVKDPYFAKGYLDFMNGWYGFIIHTGGLFEPLSMTIPNGIEKLYLIISVFNFGPWIYMLAGPLWGHILNELLIRIIAFSGMALILQRYLIPQASQFIILGAALVFAFMPFYIGMFGTIAGGPLVLYAFLNILNKEKTYLSLAILTFYPLYSSVIYGGFALLVVMGVIYLFYAIRQRSFHFRAVGALGYVTAIYLISVLPIIFRILMNTDYVSQREELDMVALFLGLNKSAETFFDIFKGTIILLLSKEYTEMSYAAGILPFVAGAGFLYFLFHFKKWPREFWLFLTIGFVTFLGVFLNQIWRSIPMQELLAELDNSVLNVINWGRTRQMTAWLMVLCFALALYAIELQKWKPIYKKLLIIGIISLQIFILSGHHSGRLVPWYDNKRGKPYYAYNAHVLFEDVAAYINKPKSEYIVAALGFPPAPLLHNGFYTLDMLSYDYSLDYKHKFREIIAEELSKDEMARLEYDYWGQRVYIFTAELGFKPYHQKTFDKKQIDDLDLNMEAFKNLGGQYLFSAVKIANADELNLQFEKLFQHPDAWWDIYLYKAL